MDFLKEFKNKTECVNKWVLDLSPKGDGAHSVIFEAANYSIGGGGKRIRPLLSYAVCEMTGNNVDSVMPFACALEYIHTYSLIHDDLPSMDDDDLRRGLPSCHIKYGEALAILAGDGLLNYAFETICKADASAEIKVKALDIISNASGMDGMVGGQVIDIAGVTDGNELVKMYNMKTGALIIAAAKIGALYSNDEEAKAISDFAYNLGIAFQIKDDILDVEGNSEQLGKSVGSDEKAGKKTYVTYFGLQKAKEDLEYYTKKAKDSLLMFGERAEFLLLLADYLLSRNN